ncbi:MAG: hypothetical protein SGPRY_013407, partial [Prymnesium sp.]
VEAGLGGREDRVDFSSGAAARPSGTLGMDRTRSTGELANLDDEEARSSEILLHFLQSECGFAYTSATLYAWARKAGFEGWCDRKRAAFIGSVADSDCGFTDNSLQSLLYTMQRSWRRSVIHRFRGLAQRAGDEERVVASLRAVIDRAFTSAHLEACDPGFMYDHVQLSCAPHISLAFAVISKRSPYHQQPRHALCQHRAELRLQTAEASRLGVLAAEVRAFSPRVWVVTLYSRALYSQLQLENEDYLLIVHKIAMKEAAYKGKLRKYRSERSAKRTSSAGRTMDDFCFASALLSSWARVSGVLGSSVQKATSTLEVARGTAAGLNSVPSLKALSVAASLGALHALPAYIELSEQE